MAQLGSAATSLSRQFRSACIHSFTSASVFLAQYDGARPLLALREGVDCRWGEGTYRDTSFNSRAVQFNTRSHAQVVPHVLPGYWAAADRPTWAYHCDTKWIHPDWAGCPTKQKICINDSEGLMCAAYGSCVQVLPTGSCTQCEAGANLFVSIVFGVVVVILRARHQRPSAVRSQMNFDRRQTYGADAA